MHSLLTAVSEFARKKKSTKPALVAVLAEERDRSVVSAFCRHGDWDVCFAESPGEALAAMERVNAHILFIDRDLAGDDWRTAISSLSSASADRTCVMLVSRVVDTSLWNEVVLHGGYEVLPKPLREDDVSRAVKLAWSYWESAKR